MNIPEIGKTRKIITFNNNFPADAWTVVASNTQIDSSKVIDLKVFIQSGSFRYSSLPVYMSDQKIAVYNNVGGPVNNASGVIIVTIDD